MLSRFHRLVVISTVAAILTISSGSFITAGNSNTTIPPCSATVCLNPVCNTPQPYRCEVSSNIVTCSADSSALPANCNSVCDVSSCATDNCDLVCPPSICQQPPCPSFVPFLCYKGESQGCSKDGGFYLNTSTCGACCDVNLCPTPPPPPPPFNCDQDCRAFCHSQSRCPTDQPFMCTSGRGKDSCSSNATLWPSESNFCQSCCDVRKCSTKCTECPKDQCISPTCPSSVKYTCTGGQDKGGCGPTPDYWNNNPACTSCCYCPSSSSSVNEHKKKDFSIFP